MKQIDLGPDDYKTQGPDGRWRIPDDPRVLIFGLVLDAVLLIALYIYRDVGSSSTSVILSSMLAFFGGLLVARLLKNVY